MFIFLCRVALYTTKPSRMYTPLMDTFLNQFAFLAIVNSYYIHRAEKRTITVTSRNIYQFLTDTFDFLSEQDSVLETKAAVDWGRSYLVSRFLALGICEQGRMP